jgi:hypothetical protein
MGPPDSSEAISGLSMLPEGGVIATDLLRGSSTSHHTIALYGTVKKCHTALSSGLTSLQGGPAIILGSLSGAGYNQSRRAQLLTVREKPARGSR